MGCFRQWHQHIPFGFKRLTRYLGLAIGVAILTILPTMTSLAHLRSPTNLAANPPAPRESSVENDPIQRVQQGKTDFNTGRFGAAIQQWQGALDRFKAQNDTLNQSIVLSNLALAYQQLGQWPEANQAILTSIQLLQRFHPGEPRVLAEAFNSQGSIQLAQGQAEAANDAWQQAAELFRQGQDVNGTIRSWINQTQALRSLGLYLKARSTLEQVAGLLQAQPPSLLKTAGLLNFGDALRVIGDLEQSRQVLHQSLEMAQALQSPPDIAAASLSLGNTARAQGQPEALGWYARAIATSPHRLTRTQAQLNQLRLLLEQSQTVKVTPLLAQIQQNLEQLPLSRATIYARINYAESLLKLAPSDPEINLSTIAQLLKTAVQQARELSDPRAESYAIGYLGGLYEQQQQWPAAQQLTEQALRLAEVSNTPDIAYRWAWQLGRLQKRQGDLPAATAAYSSAVKMLGKLRNDLISTNLDVQFSFRESVEPVYRELVALLLETAPAAQAQLDPEQKKSNLQQAREVIEGLQLAELDNFFREACLSARPVEIDKIDPTAAVLYPIILPDRLEVVLSLPDQSLRHYTHRIPQAQAEALFQTMRASLSRETWDEDRLPIAQQLYDILIRPAEAALEANQIRSLAFVLDGPMRNVPMAALHDGKQYLLEKYSLALTPGLQLLPSQTLTRKQLKVLVAGLSESTQGFISLPGVADEVKQIKAGVPAQVLLNQSFTRSALKKQVQSTPFPVIHLATHGQFSSDPDQTFVLTWDSQIKVKDLGALLQTREQAVQNPVELLILSACQTAEGDNRAALGLAGVAVRSGARSTVATLWPVDDRSTSLFMGQLYQKLLDSQLSKAEVLREAQLSLLNNPEFRHPFYWAPFVLVGNWI